MGIFDDKLEKEKMPTAGTTRYNNIVRVSENSIAAV